jgi:hypothetical protein
VAAIGMDGRGGHDMELANDNVKVESRPVAAGEPYKS